VDFLIKDLEPKPNVQNFAEGGASAQEDLPDQVKEFLDSDQAVDPRLTTYGAFLISISMRLCLMINLFNNSFVHWYQ